MTTTSEQQALTQEMAGWASTLGFDDLPERVVELAKSQILSQLAAARAGLSHPLGQSVTRAFGPPLQEDPKQSACVLAGLTAWLHFDDTAYAGHLSHSTANVPFAYARPLGVDGRQLIASIVSANECAARVTAAATLGPFRGQSAAYSHVVGAVAGRLRSEGAPREQWVDALGIALAMTPWTLVRGFLGSDAKVMSGFIPIRTGLDACDAAAAGLRGAPDILEHDDGFLAQFATVPLPETITAGLGRRWHTDTLSYKVHPGGPGIDAGVDCALLIHRELGAVEPDQIEEIVIDTSIYTFAVDYRVAPYVDGPRSPVSALVFTVAYNIATALLTGRLTAADYASPRLDDPVRWSLAEKVRLEHDPSMTLRGALATVPVGEALREAGERAADWLPAVSGESVEGLMDMLEAPSETFEDAEKVTPARVTVRLTDGRELTRERDIPVGAVGPETRASHARLVTEKFLATGGPLEVAHAVAAIEDADPGDVARLIEAALGAPAAAAAKPRP